MDTIRKILWNNGLSIVFFSLFVVAFVAQSMIGVAQYDAKLASYHLRPIGFWQYLGTGDFWNGVFVNWQAALLQLTCLIYLGAVLHQKGAPHSRKLEHDGHEKPPPRSPWLKRNSLGLAMLVLFLISFGGHVWAGAAAFNSERALTHDPPVSLAEFFVSTRFWFENTQTWQAEFLAIGAYVVLSIFLRQQDSPESKPVESSDAETGEPQD